MTFRRTHATALGIILYRNRLKIDKSQLIMYNKAMKLEFKINKPALVKDAFSQKSTHFNFLEKLKKNLWDRYYNEPPYHLLNPLFPEWGLNEIFTQAGEIGFEKSFSKTGKSLEKIYKEILKSKEFEKLLKETEKYENFVEKQWEKNKDFVLKYFKKTLGLKIPNYKITVYIFHPKSFNGHANSGDKTIRWGHSEDWKNYSTVYLAHEILHVILGQKGYSEIMHALIELATDNELRIRLNKEGEYFKEKGMNVGHEYLQKTEKKILVHWKEFLEDNKKDLFSLEKEI